LLKSADSRFRGNDKGVAAIIDGKLQLKGKKIGTVQFWGPASSAAWGCQNSESGATIPKSFGFEAATPYETRNNVTQNLTYLNHAKKSTYKRDGHPESGALGVFD